MTSVTQTDVDTLTRVAVRALAHCGRSDIWARDIAAVTDISIADAREALIRLTETGELELQYVLLNPITQREVARTTHPHVLPPERYRLTADDLYLVFRPVNR